MSRLTRVVTLPAVVGLLAGGAAVACQTPGSATPGPRQCNDGRVRADLHGDQYMGIIGPPYGAPARGCENNYALVDHCKYNSAEPCGDSSGLARYVHGRWYWYAFFPTTECVRQARLDGVPARWQKGYFRAC